MWQKGGGVAISYQRGRFKTLIVTVVLHCKCAHIKKSAIQQII